MAKAAAKTEKATTKKTKTTKKKAVAEEKAAAEQAEQAEQQNDSITAEEAASIKAEDEALKAKKAEEESTHAKYERIKEGNLYLTDLQKLTVAELHDIAKKEDIQNTALSKSRI